MSDDQSEVIAFLTDPARFDGETPAHIETHGAHVFLIGRDALKLKRSIRLDYLDFSTPALREQMLRRELSLNHPTAPQIYRDVIPITRQNGTLALDGPGEVVDWVLRMWRFPPENELSAIADRGDLSDALAEDLGHEVARYHAQAPRRDGDGAVLISDVLDLFDRVFEGMSEELGAEALAIFSQRTRAALASVSPQLTARARAGHLRRCHGDLHLRNLVLIDGRPVPFDALEFDEALGTCDVLYDMAFLVMDLLHRGLDRVATLTLNAWLFDDGGTEDSGLSALPLFLAIRAAVRAMVDVQIGRAAHTEAAMQGDARAYLAQAIAYLDPRPPGLVAVGGPSGTGKTSLARQLAPGLGAAPGAVHLRSDLERKALAGVDPLTPLPAQAYTAGASAAVYDRLLSRAETLLKAGQTVIVDATFLNAADRSRVKDHAGRLGVPFAGIWLTADAGLLQRRVAARTGDASDATPEVVAVQMETVSVPADWAQVDASATLAEMEAAARAYLTGP
ncbi:MAG: AAA family ATPase [Pseudomonadota bacterium]